MVARLALALLLVLFAASSAAAQQITCQSSVTITTAAATDTLLVAATVPPTDILVCDYEFSSAGTGNFYLETSTGTTCAGSKVQISNTWYMIANVGKTAANATFRGMRTRGLTLCANTSTSAAFSLTVYYSQQ